MSSKKVKEARSGWLYRQDAAGAFQRLFAVLKGRELTFYGSEHREEAPVAVYDLEEAVVSAPDATRVARRFAIEIRPSRPALAAPAPPPSPLVAAAESKEDQEAWLMHASTAAVPDAWPGGADLNRRPQPLLYSLWVARHTPPGAAAAAAAAASAAAAAASAPPPAASPPKIPSPFPRLPALKAAPAWQRRALLLQKLRLASVVFDGLDAARFAEEREVKRNCLLEVVDYVDGGGRAAFAEPRLLEDTFTMIRLNLFRALPRAPSPSGDPDVEEEVFTDPQWPHLNIVYELLLRLVSLDHVDLAAKKRVVDAGFVRQLLALFDSEDPRERDYLKTIAHRIYSKLTQRRALIRRVLANVFFEFVYETEAHNGIAEMLEILASIINGFAVPIKDEHKTMLVKALLPLHSARSIVAFHPQLSYCMALYVAKDHCLTREVVPGLLRYWPFGNSQKQIMFLNELEDIFEYVQDDDMPAIRDSLALRLAKCIGGLHFQVAERALLLWNSERFAALMLEHAGNRAVVLPALFPALYTNQEAHWHESIRTLSGHILEQYADVDAALAGACRAEFDARSAATAAAADAEAARRAEAAAGAAAAGGAELADGGAGSRFVRPGASLAATPAGDGADGGRGGARVGGLRGGGGGGGGLFAGDDEGFPAAGSGGASTPPVPAGWPAAVGSPGATPRGVPGAGVAVGVTAAPAAAAGAPAVAPHTPRGALPPLSVSGGAGGSGGATVAGQSTPPSSGGGGLHLGPPGGAHPLSGGGHKAPAVRGGTQFAVTSDILPGSHPRSREKRVFTLPMAGGDGGDAEGGGE